MKKFWAGLEKRELSKRKPEKEKSSDDMRYFRGVVMK